MQFNRAISTSVVLSFMTKIWGALASFLLSVTITNSMPISEAGLFFLCTSIVLVASVISRQGFDNLLVKSIAQYTDAGCQRGINLVSGWAIRRVFLISVVIAFVFNLCAEPIAVYVFNKPELGAVLAIFAWSFVTASLIQIFVSMLKGVRAPISAVFFMTAAMPTVMLGLIAISDISDAVEAGRLFLIANCIVLAVVILLWMKRFYSLARGGIEFADVTSVFGSSLLPFFYTSLLFVFIQYFTQIYVGAVLTASDVALLTVSLRVAMLISFIIVAINAVSSPRFSVFYKQGRMQELKEFSNKVSLFLFGFGLLALLFVLVFAEQILLIFGDSYVAAGGILRVIAIGQFINVATGSVGAILQMTGNEKAFLKSVSLATIVAVMGSIIFIPLYGVIAAAFVVAAAVAAQNLMAFIMVKQRLGFYTLSFKVGG